MELLARKIRDEVNSGGREGNATGLGIFFSDEEDFLVGPVDFYEGDFH